MLTCAETSVASIVSTTLPQVVQSGPHAHSAGVHRAERLAHRSRPRRSASLSSIINTPNAIDSIIARCARVGYVLLLLLLLIRRRLPRAAAGVQLAAADSGGARAARERVARAPLHRSRVVPPPLGVPIAA